MQTLKNLIKAALPRFVVRALDRRRREGYKTLSTQEVFVKIYRDGVWGGRSQGASFYSGSGSHDDSVTGPYVAAVSRFLAEFPKPPDVVDLGCGDFAVGAQLRSKCGNYIACDIVEPLIRFNEERYDDLGVEFRVLDLTRDTLPHGQVVFIRQVLQHLSNEAISRAIPGIVHSYEHLILTEHVPGNPSFVPNRDKPTGPDNRVRNGSGVVLTRPPFNLDCISEKILCEVEEEGGLIRTTAYRLR